ncbi:MAG: class I adenylate-forming enzyme family protein [Phycisphaerae bacterium]
MLFEPLFAHAQRTPDEVAVIDERGQYTYQYLANAAAGLGLYLSFQTQKSAVGLLLPPSGGFVASFYGTLLAGKTVVPINYLLGDREVAHVIKDSGIDTVITIPQLAPRLAGSDMKVIDLTQLPQTPPMAITPRFPSPAPDDMAVLLYTSGTSGLPKGVVLTYRNLQSDVDAAIEHAALRHEHKFLGVIPLFHAFGLTGCMLGPIQLGAKVVYVARFSPVAMLNAIKEHKLSIVFGVPAMMGALLNLKNAAPDDFAHTYAMITGGDALPAKLREGFKARFNVPLLEGYGLTETSPVVALNVPQASRPGSVGKLVPGAQAKIVDDDGKDVATGGEGEVWLKGPMIMSGYYNLPDETAKVLTADGYFKSGDLGKLDADGYLYITGRKKDLIISGGEKAVPREIEECLARHPAVAEAAVVGKKDHSRGEVVAAFVTLKPGATATPDEIRAFARDENLATFKVPREVIIIEELPRSPTGKVLKRVLSDRINAKPEA